MGKTKIVIRELPRKAGNGQFCTKKYAVKHPKTTVIERREVTYKSK